MIQFFYIQIACVNLQLFFNIQTYKQMKRFANTRQKLTLNRIRKGQTPPKLQIEIINGSKMVTLPPALANKDTNIIKLTNSSIFRKQSECEGEKRQHIYHDLIRCRSISCTDQNSKIKNKGILSHHKLYSNLDDKSINKPNYQETINSVCRNTILLLKQRGILTSKNNYLSIQYEHFYSMIFEILERVKEERSKLRKTTLYQDCSTPKQHEQQQVLSHPTFSVFNQYSMSHAIQKNQHLAHHSGIISLHQKYQQCQLEKQSFWRLIQNLQMQKPTQENFRFLLDKIKYLKQEISQREVRLHKLNENIIEMNATLLEKSKEIQHVSSRMREHESYLQQVEKTVKQIEGFIHKQPNKILQQQAEGYKQRQQELFDLAFLFEQSTPSSIQIFIEENIMIPFESFKLTLNSFPFHEVDEHNDYCISQKDMDAFKGSLNSAYESTIEKLSTVIDRKATKIKNFVGIMRRLASYTIGKREYLTEINKKMAAVSNNTDKNLKKLESFFVALNVTDDAMKNVRDLRQLFHSIRNIYCQAQVFY